MPHPIMFGEDDMGLAEVRGIALAFPGAFEKVSWGRPVFCAPKMFAIYGGSTKGSGEGVKNGGKKDKNDKSKDDKGKDDKGTDHVQYPHSILIKVDDSDRQALRQDTRFFYPAYLGPFGWLGLDFAARTVDWAEVGELVDASFRLVAPKKLIKQLDER